MRLTKQKGTALILALFMVGLVTVLALSMMERLNRDLRRTELLLNSTQTNLYAQGSLLWAVDTLRNDWNKQKKDTLIDQLPLSSPKNTIQAYTISSTIQDAQGFFNLNNLRNEKWAPCFQHLLLIADPGLSGENAKKITQSTINWISGQNSSQEEEDYYAKLAEPYRAPHRPMATISEFRLVRGVTADLYTRLAPYLIALPETTPLNINTAALALLQSLSPSLSLESARAIEARRRQNPFLSNEQFLTLEAVQHSGIDSDIITVSSQYFLVKTAVEKQSWQLLLFTLVHRVLQGNRALIHILWQAKGEA